MNGPLFAGALLALGLPAASMGQVATGVRDTTILVADSSDLRSHARAAQARFERSRTRHLPATIETFGSVCDEHVGRFCSWYEEGDWYPTPESPQIRELRVDLLATLDSVQAGLPGDDWVLGQRVWYLSEGGQWDKALHAASECGGAQPWWCAALEGFALHGLQRIPEAESAFARALRQMEPGQALEWRLPRRAVDSESSGLLSDLGDIAEVAPDSIDGVLGRMWRLADPLYLVDGNDRLTAHYARWTVSTLRERARNPFHIAWGRDMEELTIRHGWEIGWERSPRGNFASLDNVIGHKHPEGRDFMPSAGALREPGLASSEDLRPDRSRPRSLYAPAYAPVMLPMNGQVAIFPRGPEMVVVSAYFLPEDTTRHAEHRHAIPWLEAGDQAGQPQRAGLYLIPVDGGRPRNVRDIGSDSGVLSVTVPVGAYVVSVEAFSPGLRRAGRERFGLARSNVPDDVAALSDILLLAPMSTPPEQLEEAILFALLKTELLPGQSFAIGWEVSGLGFRPESMRFTASVRRSDRNPLKRIGDFLGITNRPEPLRVSWEEHGPDQPTHVFRYLNLDLPRLDPGDYQITLTLETSGRSTSTTTRSFKVRARLGT